MSKFATKGFVVAMMGNGGSTPSASKNCGYVYKGGSFPTTKKDGSPLENEDYVTASGVKADFPFTIGTTTFQVPLQKAYYDVNINSWLTDSGSITDTSEVTVKNKSKESYNGASNTQAEINIENASSLKEVIKNGVNDLDTITNPERRPYYQKQNTAKRVIGLYWYNTDSTEADKWESLGGNTQLEFTFTNQDTWVIAHKLNKKPNIICLDTNGDEIFGAISYPTSNNATISFSQQVSGTAYIN